MVSGASAIKRPRLILRMSDLNHLDLDGRLLQLLVAVIDEGSTTRAAHRLGITQSAVSHLLNKLRAIVDDPLFIRSGRGIVPTDRAQRLAVRARVMLEDFRGFSTAEGFNPAGLKMTVTVAANDLQRDLLLPGWFAALRQQAPGLHLRVIPSGVPSAELLREHHCDLLLTPRPPEGSDIVLKRLFQDRYVVFYDSAQRDPPRSREDWLASDHVSVLYESRRPLDIDVWMAAHGIERRIVVQVPGFSGVPSFLRAGPLLATLPSLVGRGLLQRFPHIEMPIECPSLPMYMVWHLRHRDEPLHRWLRDSLEASVPAALA